MSQERSPSSWGGDSLRRPVGAAIRVWYVTLDGAEPSVSLYHLQPRYARKRPTSTQLQRERWEANAALVHLTSTALGEPTDGSRWMRNRRGAPCVPMPGSYVSLSHVRGLAAVALAPHPVGIDIERRTALSDIDEVAKTALSEAELDRFSKLPPGDRKIASLRAWTRKESVLKGLGVGLAEPLHLVSFDEAGVLSELPRHLDDPARWTTQLLDAPGDVIGTIAARAQTLRLDAAVTSFAAVADAAVARSP